MYMITFLTILVIAFYITSAVLIAVIASFFGVKIGKPKNIILIVFFPIGMWFLK